jgi:thiamine kinase-like enzyme
VNNNVEALTPESFIPDRTRALLFDICDRVGLDCSDAFLLRHQTNAVYQLKTAPIIVKIARPDYDVEHIRRTVDLTRWLSRMNFPTLSLLDLDQPIVVNGSAVTFWPYLPQTRPIEAGDIARPLRELHALPEPPVSLQSIDAVSAIRYSLREQHILSSDDKAVLVERCNRLATVLKDVRFESAPRMIHGDPQHANTLWNGGRAILCDWDSVSFGNPEWDLVTIEVHCRRFGYSEESYRDFCRIYGRNIRDWSGYPVLRDLRELRMISTNARKSSPMSRGAVEVRERVSQIRRGESDAIWSIL